MRLGAGPPSSGTVALLPGPWGPRLPAPQPRSREAVRSGAAGLDEEDGDDAARRRTASGRLEAAADRARSRAGPPSLPARCAGFGIPFSLLSPRRGTERRAQSPSPHTIASHLAIIATMMRCEEMQEEQYPILLRITFPLLFF
ncbi:hypothetical protein BDA96_01G447900 [Sorghum bicolor]|uniref:Uncharacterized protein n=2 Tax=Sorghum bicolor TaxID=4558 RepID=A0A1B6QP37_SORBI|nr:hypothetical protein BDA96_01G447900 [Sorghum bicolor]KXG39687.1 hypothetical protein SORBI_3001G421100 [Sorghum bicolor]KXG39688.1 hypothetical protein SORBI_3001G421100 [Sorghum bicolor]